MTKKSSQGDFIARSPAFFPKALLDLKTCFKFLMFYIRWAHGLVFPCQQYLHTVKGRWNEFLSDFKYPNI